MAEAAMIENRQKPIETRWQPMPDLIEVTSLPEEEMVAHRAKRLIRYAAELATRGALDELEPVVPAKNIYDAVVEARRGDAESLKMIKANMETAVREHSIKSGDVSKVKFDPLTGSFSQIFQHGQSLENIQLNTMVYAANEPKMWPITVAEARNVYRTQNVLERGLFEDYNLVVFRRVPDNMTEEEIVSQGFFRDTMTCMIHSTSLEDGELSLETASVAGKYTSTGVQHDKQTVEKVGEVLGVDYKDKSVAEIIDEPILVHKSIMPNGVIDIVKLYDEQAGGTFFGQTTNEDVDYLEYLEFCQERAEGLLGPVQNIMGQLLRNEHNLNNPVDTVKAIDRLCAREMAEYAVFDTSINPKVFGPEAAYYIMEARIQFDLGNINMAKQLTKQAKLTSNSKSCPSGLIRLASSDSSSSPELEESEVSETWHGGKKYYNTVCNSCKKVRHEVGACRICESCVRHPARMKASYNAKDRDDKTEEPKKLIYLPEKKVREIAKAA